MPENFSCCRKLTSFLCSSLWPCSSVYRKWQGGAYYASTAYFTNYWLFIFYLLVHSATSTFGGYQAVQFLDMTEIRFPHSILSCFPLLPPHPVFLWTESGCQWQVGVLGLSLFSLVLSRRGTNRRRSQLLLLNAAILFSFEILQNYCYCNMLVNLAQEIQPVWHIFLISVV